MEHCYWEIGKSILEKQQAGWGKSVVENLAEDLQAEFPGMRGISARNLWLSTDEIITSRFGSGQFGFS